MFESFSENARSVMSRARQEAQKFRHDHMGTEHILLGLIEVKEGVAANVLRSRKVDLVDAKQQVEQLVHHGNASADGDYESLPRTPHAQHVLDDAIKEARQFKHTVIDTEHLLLGLLYEKDCIATKVLSNLGLKLDDVRKDVEVVLSYEDNGGLMV